jgi:hypothetical protein
VKSLYHFWPETRPDCSAKFAELTACGLCNRYTVTSGHHYPMLCCNVGLSLPNWSHLLCGRSHEPTSALLARMALQSVGCRLSIHPSPNALCEAARCHSAGAVRSLLVRVYGERGLAIAYHLADREKPSEIVSSQVKRGEPVHGSPDLLVPEVLRSLPRQVARFFLHEPR